MTAYRNNDLVSNVASNINGSIREIGGHNRKPYFIKGTLCRDILDNNVGKLFSRRVWMSL